MNPASSRDEDTTVVLIHGLACDGTDWKLVTNLLRERKQSYLTVDLRGHGRSAHLPGPYTIERLAEDVAHLLSEQNLRNVILVGHSMGTRVALAVRDHCGEAISQIVFVDGSCQASDNPELARQAVYDLFADDAVYRNFLGRMFRDMFFSEESHDWSDAIVVRALAMEKNVLTDVLADMRAWDTAFMQSSLQRLNAATRTRFKIIQSTKVDGAMERRTLRVSDDYDYLTLLRKYVGRAVFEIIEDTGHFIQHENPQAIIDLIDRRR